MIFKYLVKMMSYKLVYNKQKSKNDLSNLFFSTLKTDAWYLKKGQV